MKVEVLNHIINDRIELGKKKRNILSTKMAAASEIREILF